MDSTCGDFLEALKVSRATIDRGIFPTKQKLGKGKGMTSSGLYL